VESLSIREDDKLHVMLSSLEGSAGTSEPTQLEVADGCLEVGADIPAKGGSAC
jgi:hypothetical protein